MTHLWGRRTAGAIGIVLALSTTALGEPAREPDKGGYIVCARCLDELRVALQAAAIDLAHEDPDLEQSLLLVMADLDRIAVYALFESVGDDAQLANVDLQNILQKQQQTLQMLSNISKMLYDTAMSIIRKMGG